jgi:tetratricopeptide (TPR) repeat protein
MAKIKRSEEALELFNEAFFLDADNEYAKAAEGYSKLLELLPNDDDTFERNGKEMSKDFIYNCLGSCYEHLEQEEKALDDYSKAISINPKESGNYSSRAGIYIALGEMEKAKADLEKAVELNPKEAGYYYNLFANKTRNLTGDKKTASVYYKKSVEHGDYNGWSKEQLDEWGM